jgi:hypothetical protein
MAEKLLKLPRHPHQIEQRAVLTEINQQVNVTVRPFLAAGNGAEQADPPCVMAHSDCQHLLSPRIHEAAQRHHFLITSPALAEEPSNQNNPCAIRPRELLQRLRKPLAGVCRDAQVTPSRSVVSLTRGTPSPKAVSTQDPKDRARNAAPLRAANRNFPSDAISLGAKLGASSGSPQATPAHAQLPSLQLNRLFSDVRQRRAMPQRCLLSSGSRVRILPGAPGQPLCLLSKA